MSLAYRRMSIQKFESVGLPKLSLTVFSKNVRKKKKKKLICKLGKTADQKMN